MSPLSIVLVLFSALLHSSWNFITKKGSHPIEFFFWIFLSGTLGYLPFLVVLGSFPPFLFHMPPKLWGLSISSGFLEAIYFICLVGAYRLGDLSLVYPLSRSSPVFAQFWAMIFIGETLSQKGILGIALVVLGLFVISLKGFKLSGTLSPFLSRPYALALGAAIASSVYSVIDKIGVQMIHPALYLWLINVWMMAFTGLYLVFCSNGRLLKVWRESKKEILLVTLFQNVAYLLVLMALQMSKVSYVVAFRQVGALFGAIMGVLFLEERHWKTRITGALILTGGLIFIGLAR